jgi:hypothetical protein
VERFVRAVAGYTLPSPEALRSNVRFGLVVVVVHAGADERLQCARGQIERGRAWRAGHVDVVFIAERRSRVLPGVSPSI